MDRMRDYLKTLCAGWPVETVNAIVAETLHELIDPMVYAEAVALFDEHHAAGRDVVIVSSSGEEVVGPIGDMLGVDHVIATRMVVEDGKYTGEIAFYAYGEGKAEAIRELARARLRPRPCWAYSDSYTDRPDARGRRQPGRGEPRQAPAPARRRAGVAAAGVQAAGTRPHASGAGDPGAARAAGGVRRGGRRGRRRGPGVVGRPPPLRPCDRPHIGVLRSPSRRRTTEGTDHRQRAGKTSSTAVRA
jgi:HAD superfamily phosphoserine phosphatase-like hydrolase